MTKQDKLNKLKEKRETLQKQIARLDRIASKKEKEEHFGDLYVDDAVLYVPGAATGLIGSFAYEAFEDFVLPTEYELKTDSKVVVVAETAIKGACATAVYLPLIAVFGAADIILAIPHATKTGVKTIIRKNRNKRIKKAAEKSTELKKELKEVEKQIKDIEKDLNKDKGMEA